MAKTPASRKAKGRRLQNEVAEAVKEHLRLADDDIRSLPMGAPGEDIWLSAAARRLFPFSVECKYTERLSLYAAFRQAEQNSGDHIPLVVHRRNHKEALAILRFSDLLGLLK